MQTRLALAQFSGNRDREVNVRKAEDLSRVAAAKGAQIICFPELCNTSYFCYERKPEYFEWAETVPGPAVDRMRAVARETEMLIVYPMFERDGEHFFNTAVLIGPDGELLGKYRKNCIARMSHVDPGETTSDEKFYFEQGNSGLPVFDTPFGIKIGILICRDRHYSEAARIMALNGAHLLLAPSATFREWARAVWAPELQAHAIQNCYYVGGVNKVGVDIGGSANRFHFGTSVFVNPRGEVLSQAGRYEDEVIYGEVDPQVVADTRSLTDFFSDRRPELYGQLAEQPAVAGIS